jgi:AAA domain
MIGIPQDPRVLAGIFGVDLDNRTTVKGKAKGNNKAQTNGQAEDETVELELTQAERDELTQKYPRVLEALRKSKIPPDRSADVYRIAWPCFKTDLDEVTCERFVRKRKDLAGWLDEKRSDEIARCYDKFRAQAEQQKYDRDVAVAIRKLRVTDEAKRQFAIEQQGHSLEPPRAPLRDHLLTLDGLLNLPTVEPLIDGLIYCNTLTQLSGPPGCFKSFLAVGVSCCLATGIDLGPFTVPKPRTVVYVVAEGANGMGARILAWCEEWGFKPEVLFERLHILPLPIQLGEVMDVTEAAELVRELKADLFVIDTRARCTVGLEENSATEQGKAIEACESIRRANSCTVWDIHHSPREGNAGRGSNAWDGAVWSDLRMKREGLQATVVCQKHKDVPDGCDHKFLFASHTVSTELMPGVKEPWRQTLVLSRKRVWTDAVLANSRQVVLEIIRTKAPREGLSATEVVNFAEDEGISRSTTYEALKELLNDGLLLDVGSSRKTRYVAADENQ